MHAIEGVMWAFRTQPNFLIHFTLAGFAILLGWFFAISSFEWVLLVFTIFWGLTVEMLNTAVEAMTDLITTEWKKDAKIAKDVAAGMVLITAIGTAVVAGVIFVPKIFQLLH